MKKTSYISQVDLCIKTVEEYLSKNRFKHSLRVAKEASRLAKLYNKNEQHAYIAGLLHDIAKELTLEEMISECVENNLILPTDYYINRDLMHGHVSALIAKRKFAFLTDDLLNAVAFHTTARPRMTDLEKIIYVADFIEPGRKFNQIERIKKLAYDDLDSAVLEILNISLMDLLRNDRVINGYSIDARNWLMNHIKGGKIINNIVKTILDAAESKKAQDVKVLDISKITSIADYFVIMTGSSTTNIKAIADGIMEKVSGNSEKDYRVEGYNEGKWILIDMYDVVVHVFHEEERSFYNLEKLWSEAPVINI